MRKGLWIVSATVAGGRMVEGVPALIDSGSTHSFLDEKLVRRARLGPVSAYADLWRGKKLLLREVELHAGFVKIESQPRCRGQVFFMPLADEFLPEGVEIILGMDFLRQVSAKVDFSSLTMECEPVAPEEFLTGYQLKFKRMRAQL